MNDTTNAAKRPSGLRACADGLDANPDKDFAQKCMRHAADRMEDLETELTAVTEQRDRLAEALRKCREDSVCHQRRMEDLGYTYAAKESQANSDRAYIALQSLTTNTPDQERKSLASDDSI